MLNKKRTLAVVLLVVASAVLRADQWSASIRNLIDAHQRVAKLAQQECNQGDGIACDKVLVAQARISLLSLELRHRSGKVHDALQDVDTAMSDLEDVVDDQ